MAEDYLSTMIAGDFDAVGRFMAPGMTRIAPLETGGDHVALRGPADIMANSQRLNADLEIHDVDADGPFVADDRFAIRFTFDMTHIPSGKRHTAAKMSLYTVVDGLIAREEVHYFDPPQPTAD
ncbi:nuclear transport factor 2 family protein [Jiangella asiatica]|uniref:nuclear transport factor 2 family protein n=1 Tax=Jiangella asiatica TaxID=2530372 RepID=UPI003B8384BE